MPELQKTTSFGVNEMKIINVKPRPDFTLEVVFDSHIVKSYDMKKWFSHPMFSDLKEFGLFKNVLIEPGGYALSWTPDIDISEHEIWSQGQTLSAPNQITQEVNHAPTARH